MARALVVGCGCCARGAGVELLRRGWAVRGTSRSPDALEEIAAVGIEPALADPDRVGSLVELLGDVAVVVWPFGVAAGGAEGVESLHGDRLESLLAKLVDSPVRGLVYEAAGTVSGELLARGREQVETASRRFRLPVRIVEQPRAPTSDWAAAVADAVEDVVGIGAAAG